MHERFSLSVCEKESGDDTKPVPHSYVRAFYGFYPAGLRRSGAACLAMAKTDYLAETMAVGTNLALLAGIGMLALLAVSTLVSKRKALVYDTDAFYLYSVLTAEARSTDTF